MDMTMFGIKAGSIPAVPGLPGRAIPVPDIAAADVRPPNPA
jgi:hypothetical protein